MVHGETWKGSTRYWNYFEDYWHCAGRLSLSAVNAIAWPDKLGTHLMEVGSINKWTPP